jgi:hypothetical protein
VNAPELAVTAAEATVVFAERLTPLGADTALVRFIFAPVEVIEALQKLGLLSHLNPKLLCFLSQ